MNTTCKKGQTKQNKTKFSYCVSAEIIVQNKQYLLAALLDKDSRVEDKVIPEPLSLIAAFLKNAPGTKKCKICILCNVLVLEAVAGMHFGKNKLTF